MVDPWFIFSTFSLLKSIDMLYGSDANSSCLLLMES
uniref:Uncharacterized protein n=1 Tax=Arundo donax TaxID=35708 RepID=A0A0A9DHA9_ARUDO